MIGHTYQRPQSAASRFVSICCPSFCCSLIIALIFFFPYFFLVFNPLQKPEHWVEVVCVLKDKWNKDASTASQNMYYTTFLLEYTVNNTLINGTYHGCYQPLASKRNACADSFFLGNQYVCRYDRNSPQHVVIESDWKVHLGMILLIMISVTFSVFICCFLCLCLGILCSDRLRESHGYTTLHA